MDVLGWDVERSKTGKELGWGWDGLVGRGESSEGRRYEDGRQVERLGIGVLVLGVLALGVLVLGVLALGVSVVALLVGLGKLLLDGIEATLVLSGGDTKALDVLCETIYRLEATACHGLRFQGLLTDEPQHFHLTVVENATSSVEHLSAVDPVMKVFRHRPLIAGAQVAPIHAREGGIGEGRDGESFLKASAATTTAAATATTGSSEGAAVAAASSGRRAGSLCVLKPVTQSSSEGAAVAAALNPVTQINATTDASRTTRAATDSRTSDEGRGVGVGGTTGAIGGSATPIVGIATATLHG